MDEHHSTDISRVPPPAPPAADVEPPRSRGQVVATHLLGSVATLLAAAAFSVALIIASLGLSYCNEPVTPDSEVGRARILLVLGALAMAAVPAGTALLARRVRTTAVPWWIIAGLLAIAGSLIGGSVEATMWCLF